MLTMFESDVGRIRGEVNPDLGLVVHVDIYKWDPESFEQAQQEFDFFVGECKANNVPALFAGIPKTDKKNQKFATMFGFEETDRIFLDAEGKYLQTVWIYPIEE